MDKIKNRLIYITYVIVAIFLANCNSAIKEAPILLFNGKGTSPNDVEAIKNILSSNHMDFAMVNSAQLNELDTSQLRKYKLIIMPGGNFIDIGKNLTERTTGNIQKAIHEGLNYLGICAGGFLAGNSSLCAVGGDGGSKLWPVNRRPNVIMANDRCRRGNRRSFVCLAPGTLQNSGYSLRRA